MGWTAQRYCWGYEGCGDGAVYPLHFPLTQICGCLRSCTYSLGMVPFHEEDRDNHAAGCIGRGGRDGGVLGCCCSGFCW
jgi:hypothetical protein